MSVTIELPVQSQHAVLHVGRCFSAIGVLGGRGLPSPCGTHRPCSRRGGGYGRRIVEVCENCTLDRIAILHTRGATQQAPVEVKRGTASLLRAGPAHGRTTAGDAA